MSVTEIFESIAAPAPRQSLAINDYAEWRTWSGSFRECILDLRDWLLALPEPKLTHIHGLEEYDYTFALQTSIPVTLSPFIRSLCAMRRPHKIILLTKLLDEPFDGGILRRLFALMRGSIAEMLGDQRFCLYAPLSTTGRKVGDFALHADLYLPEILFNVFERVPRDCSGGSTFLAVRTLRELLEGMDNVPAKAKAGILECFDLPPTEDRYEKLFHLLHGPARWSKRLEKQMREHQLRITLARGEGYLIHDRSWLHGREAPSGGVSSRRLHRLIFNNLATQKRVTTRAQSA